MFIGGTSPNAQDAFTYEAFSGNAPCAIKYPGIAGWFYLIHYFDRVRESWKEIQEKDKAVKKGGEKTEKPKEKKEEKEVKEESKPEKKEEDIFEVDEEEDPEKAKARQARMKAALEKKKQKDATKGKKEEVIAKSLILLDIKVWEQEQDLDALAKMIKEIEMDGLVWKEEYKTPVIAFGMKKLVLGLVVEDEKVSVEDVIEKILSNEDIVQSVDIASFGKI
jgi:translation elongation factor EF-1beta